MADSSDPNLVPFTPIYRTVREVKSLQQKARVLRAREIARNPAGIAAEFAESVRLFSTGYRRGTLNG